MFQRQVTMFEESSTKDRRLRGDDSSGTGGYDAIAWIGESA